MLDLTFDIQRSDSRPATLPVALTLDGVRSHLDLAVQGADHARAPCASARSGARFRLMDRSSCRRMRMRRDNTAWFVYGPPPALRVALIGPENAEPPLSPVRRPRLSRTIPNWSARSMDAASGEPIGTATPASSGMRRCPPGLRQAACPTYVKSGRRGRLFPAGGRGCRLVRGRRLGRCTKRRGRRGFPHHALGQAGWPAGGCRGRARASRWIQ